MTFSTHRIGVLTGGGDCPGLNAVIRAVVKTAITRHGWEVIGIEDVFDTAVNTAMETLDRLHTTAESHHRAMILEVMGRDTGWIALQAGIAGGADVILIPEIPCDIQAVAAKVRERNRRGVRFSILVVAEGARRIGGETLYQAERDLGGVPRLGGIGEAVAAQLKAVMDVDVRVTVSGHVQRGGSPSAYDRLLASRFGAYVVQLIAEGRLGHMVALRDDRLVAVPPDEAVGHQKRVPLDGDVLAIARGLGVGLGDAV